MALKYKKGYTEDDIISQLIVDDELQCPYCNKNHVEFKYRSVFLRHIRQSHVQHCVVFQNELVISCKCNVKGSNHYHCPNCSYCSTKVTQFCQHIKKQHRLYAEKWKDLKKSPQADNQASNNISVSKESTNKDEESINNNSANKNENTTKTDVPQDSENDMKDSLNKPDVLSNKTDKTKYSGGVCVDREEGIFLVRRSQHGGIAYPWNFVRNGNRQTKQCEVSACKIEMQLAMNSGLPFWDCSHMKDASSPIFQTYPPLDYKVVNDLGNTGSYRALKESTVVQCKELREYCKLKAKEPVGCYCDRRYFHLSVFHGEVDYF